MSQESKDGRRKPYDPPRFVFDQRIEASAATCDPFPTSNLKTTDGELNGMPGAETCQTPNLNS